MKIVVLCTLIALGSYSIGLYIGRLYGRDEVLKEREELGLDNEPEDEWEQLFKG